MKPGSVIVDLGADGGGNCELSRPGETVQVDGVTIMAPLNLPATVPLHASLLFSRNLTAFVQAFTQGQGFLARLRRRHPAGRRHHPRGRGAAWPDPRGPGEGGQMNSILLAVSLAAQQAPMDSASAAVAAPPAVDFWSLLFVFVLSTFIGLGVIRRVSRLLHTPLMSITNAISAIAVVGSIIVAGGDYPQHIRIMGAIALFASMTNIVSGFLITDRMLKMFKTEGKAAEGGHS